MKSSRLIAFAVVLLFASVAFCSLSASAEGAMIWTDKQDYAPEETVTIHGSGFISSSAISINVARPDGVVDSWSTVADDSGSFVTTYLLDGILGVYEVNATDGINTVATTFTDTPPALTITTTVGGTVYWSFVSGANTYSGTVGADSTVTLTSPSVTIPAGTVISLTANPSVGYDFNQWSGDLTGSTNPTSITIGANQQRSVTAHFVGFTSFKACGYKNDTSGNNLNDWEITLTKTGGGSWTVKTGNGAWDDGYYEFIITSAGDYTISETLETGWTSISPSADYAFTATSGHADIKGRDFVNFQWATITVTKHDTEENPLDGWDVAIDGPDEDDDQSGTTGDDGAGTGAATFTVKHPGDFTVSETPKTGWTAISSDTNPVSVATGGMYNFDFVNFQNVVVTVDKHDTEGRDVASWDIYLDGPGEAAFDAPHEQTETTDTNGQVTFTITAPGDYRITEESKSGWTAIAPTLHDFTAVSGGSYGPYTFVNFDWLTISGNKYEYAGGYATSFNDLDGWTIYSGTWSNEGGELSGQSSSVEAWIWNDEVFSGDTSIQWRMKFLSTPTDGVGKHGGIMSFSTTQTQRYSSSGYTIDWIDRLSDHGFRIYKWTGGSFSLLGILGSDFELVDGQWYALKVEMVGPVITLYVDGVLMGSVTDGGVPYTSGYVGFWLYSNGEHAHFDDLCVMDISKPLSGWDMILYSDGTVYGSTTTDGDGYYEFTVKDPGTYSIAEVLKAGWTAVCPVHEVGSDSVTEEVVGYSGIVVQSGTDIDCKDFWNFEWASVQVVKEDTEGNKLTGWTINLAGPDSQSGDTAGASGSITFTIKEPGGYTVTEVLKSGWTQVGDTSYQFTADSGGTYGPYTFVNFEWVIVSGYKYDQVDGFCDDFESETLGEIASKWTSISGVWRVETDGSQVYSVDRATSPNVEAIAVAGDTSWTDYILQYRFKIRENGIEREGSVFVRADSNAQNGYLVHPQVGTPDTGHIALWKRVGGVDTLVATAYGGIVSDTWYLITVVVQGSSIRVYVDGSSLPLIDYTDSSSPFLSGQIGLRLFDNRHAHYDDICVVPIVDAIEGWPMKIYNDGNLYDETTTDADGYYEFEIKDPGDYAIKEVLPTDWTAIWPVQQVGPDSGDTEVQGYGFTVVSGEDVMDRIFVNFEWATIAGTKTEYGGSELSGWTIKAVCGATVYSDDTDSNGDYLITVKLPGEYDIMEVLKGGWTMTLPSEYVGSGSDEDVVGYEDVTIGSGDALTGKDFENFQWASICGRKFLDTNGDGLLNDGSTNVLTGWTMKLYRYNDVSGEWDLYDTQLTRTYQDGEDPGTVGTITGRYCFVIKNPGTYEVREILSSGWTMTKPFLNIWEDATDDEVTGYTETPLSGQALRERHFANFQWASVCGRKFLDTNGDGVLNDGEDNVIEGWTIKLYRHNTVTGTYDLYDTQTTRTYEAGEDPGTESEITGRYCFVMKQGGTYQIREALSSGWTMTVPFLRVWEGSGDNEVTGYTIDPTSGGAIRGKHFANFEWLTISGHKYVSGTTTPIPGWHVQLFKADAQVGSDAVTDASGAYSFIVKTGGTYSIKEVLQDKWTQTSPVLTYSPGDGSTPSVLGYDGITVVSGTDVSGKDFENFQWLTICGVKFEDNHGNGVWDDADTGMNGWTIKLYMIVDDSDELVDAQVTRTYTKEETGLGEDIVGRYCFVIKRPGTYEIKEVLPTGWTLTCPKAKYQVGPDSGTIEVLGHTETVQSGVSLTGRHFGNFQWLTICGRKFVDVNGDGIRNDGDSSYVSGWTIKLYKVVDGPDILVDTQVTRTYTAEETGESEITGRYCFTVKEPGTHRIAEELKPCWTLTYPVAKYRVGDPTDVVEADAYTGISVRSGTNIYERYIGNFEWLTISGNKYEYGICDDFEDGDASSWTPVNGIWTVVDDSGNMVYMQSLPYYIPGVRVAGEATWTDYVIQAKVKVTGTDWGRWGGLLFRVSDPGTAGTAGTYYELYLQENGNLQLVKTVSGTRTPVVNPFVGLFYNEWWYIKAEVIGGHIKGKAWEAGTPEPATWIVDYTDPSPIASGKIGLITFSNVVDQPVLFDDVCLKVPLEDWHLQLFSGSTQVGDDAVTGPDGAYSFTVKEPGTYSVKEVLPTGWTELLPEVHYGDGSAVLGYDGIVVSSGTDITGKDFLNFEWLTISGTKFFDANGNGEKDAGEPGLQYWVIKLFRGAVQYGTSATTAADGSYSFLAKDPGTYSIKEVLKPWWIMTHPGTAGPNLVPELVAGYCGIVVMSGTDMDCMDFGNWLGSSSIVTTSDLCLFDYDDSTDGRQFKLIFTPDVPTSPSLYRLTASNPGQFYYNVFFVGDVEVGDEFTIYLPFPFVTQGAVPVHVYSSLNTGPCGCLIPVGDITYKFDVEPQTIGLEGSYDSFGDYAEIALTATESHSGFVYIAVHLDYGLKKNLGSLSVGSSNQAIGSLTILDQNVYVFAAQGPGGFDTQDGKIRNMNVFKRDPGFGGLVLDANGDPVQGATVKVFTSGGALLGTVVTDEDGWYMFSYKHKGKSAAYTIQMSFSHGGVDYTLQETVTVKANSFALVNFILPMAVPRT